MKKIFAVCMMMLMMIFAGCGGGNTSAQTDGSSTLDGEKKIIIGVDDEFPPISFHDEKNNLVGFDVDLAKEAARRMKVEIEFKHIDWDKKKEAITSGSVDMIWNGLDITEERKEYMIFTKPYMDDRQILLVKEGNVLDIASEGDLEGKIVGTQAGSTSDDYINANESLKETFKEYKTYVYFGEVLDALKGGAIDVIICDELIARYEANQNPGQLELVNVKIGSVAEMAVGFAKDKTGLRDKVQAAFDEMVADGTAKKISERWFKADVIRQSWDS